MTWLRSHLFRKPESGQGTIEYVGVAVLISVLIASLAVAPVAPKLGTAIKDTICKVAQPVLGGTCEGQEPERSPEDYMPTCTVATDGRKTGSTLDVWIIKVGQDVSMKVEENSDGTAKVTLVTSGKGGVSLDVAKGKAGDIVDLSAGANEVIKGSVGDVFKFDNVDDALAFAKQNSERNEHWSNYVPIPGLGPALNPHKKPENPDATYFEVDLSAGANGSAKVKPPGGSKKEDGKPEGSDGPGGNAKGSDGNTKGSEDSGSKPNNAGGDSKETKIDPYKTFKNIVPGGSLSVDRNVTGKVMIDRGKDKNSSKDDTYSYTYSVGGSGQAGLQGFGLSGGGNAKAQTAFTVKQDSQGNIIGFTINQEFTGGGGMGDAKDDNKSIMYTADLDLSDPASRKVVEEYLQNPGGVPDLRSIHDGNLNASTPEQKAMADLLQSPALSLSENHIETENSNDNLDFGGKVASIGLGYGMVDETSSSRVTDSYAWVPDQSGGRKRVKNTNCIK